MKLTISKLDSDDTLVTFSNGLRESDLSHASLSIHREKWTDMGMPTELEVRYGPAVMD